MQINCDKFLANFYELPRIMVLFCVCMCVCVCVCVYVCDFVAVKQCGGFSVFALLYTYRMKQSEIPLTWQQSRDICNSQGAVLTYGGQDYENCILPYVKTLNFVKDVEYWSSECSESLNTCHAYRLSQLSGQGNIQKLNKVDKGTSANKIFTMCGTGKYTS